MYNLSNGFLNVFHSTPDLGNGLRFNVIYEFNHIRIMLYNTIYRNVLTAPVPIQSGTLQITPSVACGFIAK